MDPVKNSGFSFGALFSSEYLSYDTSFLCCLLFFYELALREADLHCGWTTAGIERSVVLRPYDFFLV